ncbi:TniQ family protein [Rhizobium sp. YS-1r]|uniref:TniQ family protein n=1 Tax=Rhizobium sp. YS-1r TaxID=1532558 RepID=UPI0005103B2C|nr:TniQ family protein [Rhizobium sp. YS-1r]KGD87640.1 hypothetical protein JL39_25680 [Rhizobium sp. YS-1r]
MKLPISITFHDNETPLGFVSRLAAANGYPSLETFLDCTETSALAISRGDAEAMALLEEWSGEEGGRFARFAARTLHGKLCFDLGDAVFSREYRRGKAHRFCVRCVQDDLRNGEGRIISRPYVRAWWETRAIQTCPIHGSRITEVACESGQDDFASYVRTNPHVFADNTGSKDFLRTRKLDLYLMGRIQGVKACDFLDGLEAYVVADLSKHFGRLLARHGKGSLNHAGQGEFEVAEHGFLAVKLGEEFITERVSAIIQEMNPAASEVRAVLDPIPRWLRRNREVPAFASLVQLFQDVAERNMPLGEGDLCIIPTRRRYLHTVRSAGLEYGLMEDRVIEILRNAGIMVPSGLPNGRACFDAELARPILSAARETITISEAEAALGLNRQRLHEIMEAGLLRRVEDERNGQRVYTRIRKEDLGDFQSRLFERAQTRTDLEGFMPVVQAAHRCNRQLWELVQMILDGQVNGIAKADDAMVFSNLFVDWKELQSERRRTAKQDIGVDLLSIKEAAAILKTTQCKVYPLVSAELLPAIAKYNKSSHREQFFIEPEALEEFQRLHISIAGIASIYGTRADVVARRMELLGIEPSFEPGSRTGRYYRRSDLEKFTFDRLAA